MRNLVLKIIINEIFIQNLIKKILKSTSKPLKMNKVLVFHEFLESFNKI